MNLNTAAALIDVELPPCYGNLADRVHFTAASNYSNGLELCFDSAVLGHGASAAKIFIPRETGGTKYREEAAHVTVTIGNWTDSRQVIVYLADAGWVCLSRNGERILASDDARAIAAAAATIFGV